MKKLSYVLSFVFILATVFVIVGCTGTVSAADDTYVTIEINPSIELIVSPREKVLYANPLNEDGEILLANLDLIGLPLDEAIDLIIAESISLGFIDVDSEETIVSVSTFSGNLEIGERIREKVKEGFNNAFMNRAMMGRAEDKGYTPEFLAEAESYGVTPGFLALVKSVIEVDETILLEDALLMSQQDLMDILHDAREANREAAQTLREEFFAARQLIFDEYLPQIQALETEIAAAAEDVDTTDLEAQLETLRAEFEAELQALADTFHEQLAALGVPRGLQGLIDSVIAVDDTILYEDAILMTQQELMAILREAKQANKEVAQALREEFFAARQLIFDEYIPQIQALEVQISAAAEGEDTTELQAQLDALKAEFEAELIALRDTYHSETEGLRAQIMEQHQLRYMEHQQKVQEFMNQMQTRKDEMQDEIEEFQGRRP